MAVSLVRRRFTVDEYYQMARAGILHEDDRVELIEGEILEMTPIGRRHAAGVMRISSLFWEHFRDAAAISVQNPVRLDARNEPQPDVALLRPRADFYEAGLPGPADVLLIVEVAEMSAALDRRVKLPLYARCGIPEVWLVEMSKQTVTAHRDPGPGGYKTVRTVRRGEAIAPLAFPDRELAVADMLGGR
jgi:Uma2 family endonuclease